MDAIEFQYKRIRQKYPDAPELEIWHGVAMDFYLRTGDIPSDVLIRSAFARAENWGIKYRPDQLRLPAGNPNGGNGRMTAGGAAAPICAIVWRATARLRTENLTAARLRRIRPLRTRPTRRRPIAMISFPAISRRPTARRLFRRRIGGTASILKKKREARPPAEEDTRLKSTSVRRENRSSQGSSKIESLME